MKYIVKTKIVASEFVVKCFVSGVIILFIVFFSTLALAHLSLAILIELALLLGLFIFTRSLMEDLFGKEELMLTERELVLKKISPLSRSKIVISWEDIVSVEYSQYRIKMPNGMLLNSLTSLRYLALIVSENRGYIKVETVYRTYSFCRDDECTEILMSRIQQKRGPVGGQAYLAFAKDHGDRCRDPF